MRRGLGRGRTLIGVGAVLAICSMPLPWLQVGGIVLSAETASGFDLARRFGDAPSRVVACSCSWPRS